MASNKRRSAVLVGCGLMASLAAADRVDAASTTLFTSNGFEPLTATPGLGYTAVGTSNTLVGQPTLAATSQKWSGVVYADAGQTNFPTASIQTYAATFGPGNLNPANTQFAEIQANAVNPDTTALFYPQANLAGVGTPFVPSASQSTVDIQFTMSTEAASLGDPFFGVIAYADSGATQIAALGIDTVTGKLVGPDTYTAAGTAFTSNLSPSTFYSYELQLNYSTDKATMFGVLNGGSSYTALGTASFAADDFEYAALATTALTGSSYTGLGLIDDYVVTAVPEPASASLVVVGVVAAAGSLRRHRRNPQ